VYCSGPGILVGRWLANASLSESQAHYEVMLAAEAAARTTQWLLDLRLAPTPPPELANWIAYNWIPRAAARTAPRLLRLAFLLSEQRARAVQADAALDLAVEDLLVPARTYDAALFLDEDGALAWLSEPAAPEVA
jgi:hypothetical protein